eukprot:Rmarinus@m.9153
MSRKVLSTRDFTQKLRTAEKVVFLTGAGISVDSGLNTYRGKGARSTWRGYSREQLATPDAFRYDPSLVWQFYHSCRENVLSKRPNAAHIAITGLQKRLPSVTVITQNVDGLHVAAETENVLEIHGSLRKVRCTKCGTVEENSTQPLCEALRGCDSADADLPHEYIPLSKLPKCKQCNGLLRPHIVWFGETLDPNIFRAASDAVDDCDVLVVVGTSGLVYPAVAFVPKAFSSGKVVAEFNIEETAVSQFSTHWFVGPCSETLPTAILSVSDDID